MIEDWKRYNVDDFRLRVERVKTKLIENPESVLNHFKLDYVNKGNRLVLRCPVHSGADNESAVSVMLDGYVGCWSCFTRFCNDEFGGDLLGLVWGILTNRQNKKPLFGEVLTYCEENIGIGEATAGDTDFVRLCNTLNKEIDEHKILGKREQLIKTLQIPSPYFLAKGFTPEILTKFSIGDCHNPQKPMHNRAVCPVFDETGQFVIGCAGRRIPEKDYLKKWKFSYGLKVGSYFYGLWEAKQRILETSRAIVVEGQADVVWLHENGYNETVGLFGANLTDNQLKLLNKLGIMNLVILMDGDEAGREASDRIKTKTQDYFNTRIIHLSEGQDPDDLDPQELNSLL